MALLRYSGGKARLVKKIISHIVFPETKPQVFAEPFVGGGSVALAVAAKHPKVEILLNDIDEDIYFFWKFVASSTNREFIALRRIVQACQPTIDQFTELKASEATSDVDRAFRTLFFNRTSFSASNGKRPLGGWDQGEDGDIDSRWNSERLANELLEARRVLAGRTVVFNKDFEQIVSIATRNWVMYLDPPYYKAGNQLYNHPWIDADHVRLCELLKKTPADWVLSYDFHPRILELYAGVARSYPMPASYSISKRAETEALFVPSHSRGQVSRLGYSAPKDFPEFFRRYPNHVRLFVERKMRWSRKRSHRDALKFTTFEAQVDDYTQDLLLFLSALPKTSKYRAMGFTDPIQLFNPGLWGGVTQQRFLVYVTQLLNNKFSTLRTHEHIDILPHADLPVGAAIHLSESLNETRPDLARFRALVQRERPILLKTFDSFFEPDLRDRIRGYGSKRSRLVAFLREFAIHGTVLKKRKEYKRRKKLATFAPVAASKLGRTPKSAPAATTS